MGLEAELFVKSILKVPQHKEDATINSKFRGKLLQVHGPRKPTLAGAATAAETKRVDKLPLSRRKQRACRLPRLRPGPASFADYEPLHSLWSEYAADVLPSTAMDPAALYSIILKMDLTGALVAVRQSSNPTHVGLEGVVVLETSQSFYIVSRDDRLTVVGKDRAVFALTVAGADLEIYGTNLRCPATARSNRKFKVRDTAGVSFRYR
ncbi:Ribonuclease P protein subunit p29 [Carpediemonas membranifera]|uniref:Ribonuclease P protein subunit p29 n=1 Tax=Carpediemonas membranifera TaxID=201153 RepID=A0A8J6E2D3_9EUKA|nr:Ribonuclease P protein subunit p29 [Carpediemonas membranifera]|eukprot:KAG9397479.1 Ribonuclease P protein subunit p29 [Carpediemonas membranifera]